MQTFQTFLTEGRDAPLYKAIQLDKLMLCMANDTMPAVMAHGLHHVKVGSLGSMKSVKGISFTRSYNYAKHWWDVEFARYNAVIIEIDQAELARTNKILPYNFWTVFHTSAATRQAHYMTQSGGKLGKQTNLLTGHTESEEFVIGDIKRFDRILKKIIFLDRKTYRNVHDTPIEDDPRVELRF